MRRESHLRLYAANEEMGPNMPTSLRSELAKLGKNWGWLTVGGICFVILGVAAFLWPVASTMTLIIALGWFFIVSGAIRGAQAIQLRREIGTGWRVFDALLSLAAGVLLLRYPGGGMIAVAIAMTFFFFMSAVTMATVAFSTRPLPGSGWAFMSAIASFALGIYMIATFPISSLWVPGALLGIDFVIYGVSLTGFSFSLRNLHREITKTIGEPTETRRAA